MSNVKNQPQSPFNKENLKLEPLLQWICDKCGTIIQKPNEGMLVWRQNENGQAKDFRIVHKGNCDDKTLYTQSFEMNWLLGKKGIENFLYLLSDGYIFVNHYKLNEPTQYKPKVENLNDFVDLFRRFQLPYYEAARILFNREDIRNELIAEGHNESSPYTEETLKNIIEKYCNEKTLTYEF